MSERLFDNAKVDNQSSTVNLNEVWISLFANKTHTNIETDIATEDGCLMK